MTKRRQNQTSTDNIFYYQEISQDILNLTLENSFEEIGFFCIFKASYFFHKGKIPTEKLLQYCRVFDKQKEFENYVKNNFEIKNKFYYLKEFDEQIKLIEDKSKQRQKAVKLRNSKGTNDCTNVHTNVHTNDCTNGGTKHKTLNTKHKTLNTKQKTSDNKQETQKSYKFTPPTLQQVKDYCQERANNVNPDKFINYYQANGWKVGKNPMKDWKACVRTWEQNSKDTTTTTQEDYYNSLINKY